MKSLFILCLLFIASVLSLVVQHRRGFTATLTPGGVLPPVDGTGSITVNFGYDPSTQILYWTINNDGAVNVKTLTLNGPALINYANAQALVDLLSGAEGLKGSMMTGEARAADILQDGVIPDKIWQWFASSRLYCQSLDQNGKMIYRGGVGISIDWTYNVVMSGATMIPLTPSLAVAQGFFGINLASEELFWQLGFTVQGATNVSLYGPSGGLQQGPLIVTFPIQAGSLISSGTLLARDSVFLSPKGMLGTLLQWMNRGQVYAQIASTNYPYGEIRGQLYQRLRDSWFVQGLGRNVVPLNILTGNQFAILEYDYNQKQLNAYMLSIPKWPQEVTIHAPAVKGALASAIGALVNYEPGIPVNFQETVILDEVGTIEYFNYYLFEYYMDNSLVYIEWYEGNEGRQTRGNVGDVDVGYHFSTVMTGLNVLPIVFTPATGSCLFFYNDDNYVAVYQISHTVVQADRAFIMTAFPLTNGPIRFYFSDNGTALSPYLFGVFVWPTFSTGTAVDGFIYEPIIHNPWKSLTFGTFAVVVGSPSYPNGEIRGNLYTDTDFFSGSVAPSPAAA